VVIAIGSSLSIDRVCNHCRPLTWKNPESVLTTLSVFAEKL